MSKLIYLMGAGASYGKREKDSNGKDIPGKIIEGLPTVDEMPIRLEKVKAIIERHAFNEDDFLIDEYSHTSIPCQDCQKKITEDFQWLIENTRKHATIDTFAKKLYMTGQTVEYIRLKRLLCVFFKIEQLINPPDSRYDTFLASVLQPNSHGNLRISEDITILTWNYDSQFEIAYLEYLSDGKYKEDIGFPSQLGIDIHSIVSDFIKPTSYIDDGERQIFKLNGSATFDSEYSIFHYYLNYQGSLIDNLIRAILKTYALPFYYNGELKRCMLNFAWDTEKEYESKTNYKARIDDAISGAASLIVIGYRFPFFNREMDSFLFSKMKSLEHIYIQDPHAGEIKESVLNVLQRINSGLSADKIVLKTNVDQFFLPPEL